METKSKHQQAVEAFMRNAKQVVRDHPTVSIPEAERILSAKLLFEECIELTKRGLGVEVCLEYDELFLPVNIADLVFDISSPQNPIEVIDGVADVHVIATGIAARYGVNEGPIIDLVDENNMAKFGPGHSIREDGKLVKPPGHRPPDIAGELKRQLDEWKKVQGKDVEK